MLPVIQAFQAAHNLADMTMIVVADAGGWCPPATRSDRGCDVSFILGARIPDVPYVVKAWRQAHPDEEIPDGQIVTQPWPAGAPTAADQKAPSIFTELRISAEA